MRAPLSIVILPAGDVAGFAASLAGLGPGLEAGLIAEVVLCMAAPGCDWLELAAMAGVDVVASLDGRALAGRWLVKMEAGTVLRPDWAGRVLIHLQEGNRQPLAWAAENGAAVELTAVPC